MHIESAWEFSSTSCQDVALVSVLLKLYKILELLMFILAFFHEFMKYDPKYLKIYLMKYDPYSISIIWILIFPNDKAYFQS